MCKYISNKTLSPELTIKRSESDGCYQAYSSILKNFTENGHYIKLTEIVYDIPTFVQQISEFIKTGNYAELENKLDKIIEFLSEANAVCKFTQNTNLCQEIEQTLGPTPKRFDETCVDDKTSCDSKEVKELNDDRQDKSDGLSTSDPAVDVKTQLNQRDHSMPEYSKHKELFNKLLKSLQECASANSDDANELAEIVLKAAYNAKVHGEPFSEEERKVIGPLVKQCIDKLGDCVFYNGYSFDIDNGPYILVLRSAIQIILDNYKHFPCGENKTLETVFINSDINESIETLDEGINDWKKSLNVLSYDNVIHTKQELTRPKDLPETHTWWFYN
ncbi:uncharacterized protein LOC131951379 isoform X2 [Physella acuta]|uniref:uncharacterized protein LOC131951379 isoform X2 n=1 Tax=Physella acuta TaxID=109671 RepID=UPI0027DCB793|nr:uncharacterized protein LOC131951379 isoform X2 [Physella acuta]